MGIRSFLVFAAVAAGTVYMVVQSEADNPPARIGGTVTAINHYPGHKRAGVTSTSTSGRFVEVTDPNTNLITAKPYVSTGPVQWNPATEVCFRYDNGTAGCRYIRYPEVTEGLHVGSHVGDEPTRSAYCAPHPAPSDEAADEACPAFADDGDTVIPAVANG